VQLGDLDGDGKADLCGRAADRVHCYLSNGAGFPTHVDGPPWSDAGGWGDERYYTTIQLADINGDGKADACARASDRVRCFLSTGTAFGSEVLGPAWSNGAGWGDPKHYTTVRWLAAAPKSPPGPGGGGAPDAGTHDAGAGDSGTDDPGMQDAPAGGCSCSFAGSRAATPGAIFLGVLFFALLFRRRRV
jgi:MYXO-CTERM domain-containing protein